MSAIENLSDDTFALLVLESNVPVLVDFYGDHCVTCELLIPALEDIAREYAGEARVMKINISRNAKTRGMVQIQGVPTVMLFVNGQIRERIRYPMTRSAIAAVLERGIGAAS